MKVIQLTILLAVLSTLHGCGFEDAHNVDVDEAVLHTPKGEFEFKRDKKRSSWYVASNSDYRIGITLFPLNNVSRLKIQSIANKSIYDIKINIIYDGAYSQLNGAKKIKLDIKESSHTDYIITPPVTMDYYKSDGDGLHVTKKRQPITKKHKKKANEETYRYYVPFTLDGEEYAIDVTFQLEINTRLRFGVPGMP
jgi:hypothetical protein